MWNGFWGPSPGADVDAAGMHQNASLFSRDFWLGVDLIYQDGQFYASTIYSTLLGVVYSVTTDALFWGSFLSALGWFASACILIRIMRMLSTNDSDLCKAMFIYALMPSAILYTSVTLREPWELLFLTLAIYAALKIYSKKSLKRWLLLIFSVACMGSMHGGLAIFALFVVLATLLLSIQRRRGSITKMILVAPFVVAIAVTAVAWYVAFNWHVQGSDVIAKIESYQRNNLLGVRSQYKDSIEINGVADLLLSIPVFLFQYLMEPLPWHVSTASDAGLCLENLLRAFLILKAATRWRSTPAQERKPLLFIFLTYLAMETMWSLTTVNWGTASRHHTISIGLLVAAAFGASQTKRLGAISKKWSGNRPGKTQPRPQLVSPA